MMPDIIKIAKDYAANNEIRLSEGEQERLYSGDDGKALLEAIDETLCAIDAFAEDGGRTTPEELVYSQSEFIKAWAAFLSTRLSAKETERFAYWLLTALTTTYYNAFDGGKTLTEIADKYTPKKITKPNCK